MAMTAIETARSVSWKEEGVACLVPRLPCRPSLDAGPAFGAWQAVPPLTVGHWHARSSLHRPVVNLRLGHTGDRLHFCWQVDDAWVASREAAVNGLVCRDSCVEAFFAPRPGKGYFNLEINAGGTVHLGFGRTSPWANPAIRDRGLVDAGLIARHLAVRSSLPPVVDPEISGPCRWTLAVDLELALLARCLGEPVAADGTWTGNFYKCADQTSHPHWGSWHPLGELLDFHQPARFATIAFAP